MLWLRPLQKSINTNALSRHQYGKSKGLSSLPVTHPLPLHRPPLAFALHVVAHHDLRIGFGSLLPALAVLLAQLLIRQLFQRVITTAHQPGSSSEPEERQARLIHSDVSSKSRGRNGVLTL